MWVSSWCSLGGQYADDLDIIGDLQECVRRLLIWKEAMEKKGLRVNAGKTKGHDLWYRPGPLAEFRRIPMHCLSDSSYRSRQQLYLLQWLNNWHQIMIIGVHGAWEMIALLMADHRVKSGLDLLITRCSSNLLPRWHAFCWWRLCNNGHYSCENSLEEVQGAITSSNNPPPLQQDLWPSIQLLP